ncbi:MAG: hypothetical protein U1E76_22985 [Planctomycetota bacterium]
MNESTRIFVKAGDTVTFRLSGSELAGATAVLSIRKAGGANFQTLPYLSGKKNDPILLKVKIPRTWKMKHWAQRHPAQLLHRVGDRPDQGRPRHADEQRADLRPVMS